MKVLQEFADATMKRFSRDKLLRMETLDISFEPDGDTIRSPPIEKLLDLASKRKAEYVSINIMRRDSMYLPSIHLPFELLSNSSAKTLNLRSIRLESNKHGNDLLVPMNCLRYLKLYCVEFEEERLFTNLIASSPNLETLVLFYTTGIKKIRLSNLPNLKKFIVLDPCVEEIEIAASGLLTLEIKCHQVFRIELIAPQLITLEIDHCRVLRLVDVSGLISKLPNLKSLNLYGISLAEQKLELSYPPKLEVFELAAPSRLEEIEIDEFRRILPALEAFIVG